MTFSSNGLNDIAKCHHWPDVQRQSLAAKKTFTKRKIKHKETNSRRKTGGIPLPLRISGVQMTYK
jgi:hypothetical protein